MNLFNKIFAKKNIERKEESDSEIAIDIGSKYIKVLIYKVRFNRIKVEGFARVENDSGAMHNGIIIDVEKVAEKCDNAIGNALASVNSDEIPTRIVFGISGDLITSEITEVDYVRPDPNTKITIKELSFAVAEANEKIVRSSLSTLEVKSGLNKGELIEFSSNIIESFIGSYRVTNPVDFTGSSLKLRVLNAYAPKVQLEVYKELAKVFEVNIKNIYINSFAIAKSIDDATNSDFNGIFIDMGAETTDISIVINGSIYYTQMFAMGGDLFTKKIEKLLGISHYKAEEKKILYSHKINNNFELSRYLNTAHQLEISKSEVNRLRTAFENECNLWCSGIELALAEAEGIDTYPPNFYLSGGGVLLPNILDSLMQYNWTEVLPFEKFPNIEIITPKMISNFDDHDNLLKYSDDIIVASLARSTLEI